MSGTENELPEKRLRAKAAGGALRELNPAGIALAAAVVILAASTAVLVLVTLYGLILAALELGAPDPDRVESARVGLAQVLAPPLLLTLTFFAARRHARRLPAGGAQAGILLGGILGIVDLAVVISTPYGGIFGWLFGSALLVLAGWFGGRMGTARASPSSRYGS